MAVEGRLLWLGPGELIVGPTNLTIASPYGGTRLPIARNAVLLIEQEIATRRDEGFGPRRAVETLELGRDYSLRASFRGWDDGLVDLLWPRTAVGSVTGRRVVREDGEARAGRRGSDRAVTLLFAAESPAHQPSVLLHRAIPHLASSRFELDLDTEAVIDAVFQAIPDDGEPDTAKLASIGLLADLAELLA